MNQQFSSTINHNLQYSFIIQKIITITDLLSVFKINYCMKEIITNYSIDSLIPIITMDDIYISLPNLFQLISTNLIHLENNKISKSISSLSDSCENIFKKLNKYIFENSSKEKIISMIDKNEQTKNEILLEIENTFKFIDLLIHKNLSASIINDIKEVNIKETKFDENEFKTEFSEKLF